MKRVQIIKSMPKLDQDELNLNDYIGAECNVVDTWKNRNNCLEDGEIQVMLEGEGIIILNPGEYKIL